MTIRFSAAAGGSEEAPDRRDNWFEVGVSENPDGSGRVLVFQCQLDEPDEQNTGLGMDTYRVGTVAKIHDGLRKVLASGRPDARPSQVSIG